MKYIVASFNPPKQREAVMHSHEFLTYKDLSERYHKSRVTLWRWVRDGRLPAPVQLGPNSVVFRFQEILESEADLKPKTYRTEAVA